MAFNYDALKVQAFERLRALIEAVVLPLGNADLTIWQLGELVSTLTLCASREPTKAPAGVTEEALQIKLVAGTGSGQHHTLIVAKA